MISKMPGTPSVAAGTDQTPMPSIRPTLTALGLAPVSSKPMRGRELAGGLNRCPAGRLDGRGWPAPPPSTDQRSCSSPVRRRDGSGVDRGVLMDPGLRR